MAEINVGFAVVGHPKREQAAKELAENFGASLFMDYEGLGEWGNHARAWESLTDYDYGVVLQDDAQPIEDAKSHMIEAIQARPKDCISFYVGTGTGSVQYRLRYVMKEMVEQNKISWFVADTLHSGVAVSLPAHLIPEMVSYPSKKPYDERIGDFCSYKRVRVSYTHPSLVDHADWPTVAHSKQNPNPRKAYKTGYQVDPTDPRSLGLW